MSNYIKATDFNAKDALLTGNPAKTIKGQEINDEFNAIQTAIATKADLSSPNLLGNPTAPTQALGNNTTRLATTAFVQAEINATEANVAITGGTISGVAISGGTITGLSTDLAVADGGTGSSTLAANNVLLGNGTSALQVVAPSTSGNVLTSDGTTWVSSALTGITPTTGSAPYYGARAWAKISGSTVNGSGNISSVTNSSTGVYDFTFTTAMPDSNYAIVATNFWRNTTWAEYCSVIAQSTTGFSIRVTDGGDVNAKNVPSVYVVVFR